MQVRKWLVVSAFLLAFLTAPAAECADFKLNVGVVRQNDGSTSGELWYNDQVIWRLTLLADGAQAVSSGRQQNTTYLLPDFTNGFWVLKVY